MRDIADAGALCRTYLELLRLPSETIEGPGCRAVRQGATPLIYMANHLQLNPGATLDSAAVFDFFEAHPEVQFGGDLVQLEVRRAAELPLTGVTVDEDLDGIR